VGTTNNTATFGVLWDNNNLYIGAKVLDANLFSDSPDLWQDDAVEIYIDANYNRSTTYDGFDNQIVQGYNKSTVTTKLNITGLQHAWAAISGGYSVEIAIPWSQLGISAPAPGTNIGFDISYDDDDNGGDRDGQATWNGTSDNYENTSAFGRLTLSAGNASRTGSFADDDTAEDYSVSLYPVPVTTGILTALVPQDWSGATDVFIRNNEGALVQTSSQEIDNHQLILNTAALSSGIYFLQMVNNGNVVTEKFIVQQ
jgi:hypothetical protein